MTHIFLSILVHGEVNRSKGPPPNLLLHHVLVDSTLRLSVVFAVGVF